MSTMLEIDWSDIEASASSAAAQISTAHVDASAEIDWGDAIDWAHDPPQPVIEVADGMCACVCYV